LLTALKVLIGIDIDSHWRKSTVFLTNCRRLYCVQQWYSSIREDVDSTPSASVRYSKHAPKKVKKRNLFKSLPNPTRAWSD